MLRELRIKNFVVIDEQTLSFSAGLSSISGDSGAGKSVVLRALQFALGEKTSNVTTLMRDESIGELSVEASFELKVPLTFEWLEGATDIIVRRVAGAQGRSRFQVNGQLVTQTMVAELGEALVLITSQAQSRTLLSPAQQLLALDTYSGGLELRSECAEEFERWRTLQRTLDSARENAAQTSLRRAELEFVVEELSKTELRPGIRNELEEQVRILQMSAHVKERGLEACALLDRDSGPVAGLRQVGSALSEFAKLGGEFSELQSRLTRTRDDLAEISRDLSRAVSKISTDERTLDRLREHLAEVARLERKYRTHDDGLIALLENARATLQGIPDESALEALALQCIEARKRFDTVAAKLSKLRARHVEKLSGELAAELKELGFEGSVISVNLTTQTEPATYGFERCDIELGFKGKDRRQPLREVASGGELSRVYLALQKIMGGRAHVPSMVFDEIDTGVSGKTARAIGTKLRELSRSAQVFCITHLAQVASLADFNFLVQKETSKGVPKSQIRVLSEQEKLEEIARMLAGYKVTSAARESARELMSSK